MSETTEKAIIIVMDNGDKYLSPGVVYGLDNHRTQFVTVREKTESGFNFIYLNKAHIRVIHTELEAKNSDKFFGESNPW